MRDADKSKAQLIAELQASQKRLAELEQWYLNSPPVTDEARREESNLLYFLSRLVQVGAWKLNPATGRSTWTGEVYRIFDIAPGGEIGLEQTLTCFHGVNRERIEQAVRQALDHGIPYDLELELLSTKGRRKWVRTIGRPEQEGGRVILLQGIIQDITKRKQDEESLRMTQFIFEKAPLGIWRMGKNGEILDVNELGAKSLGYSRDELCRMTVFDFDPDFSYADWDQSVSELSTAGSNVIESRHRRKNGEIFPIQVMQNFVRFAGHEFHVAFVQDITARKKMEEFLRLARSIIESANIGIYLIDIEGRIKEVNQKAAQLLGYSKEELETLTVADIDAQVARESWRSHWRQLTHHVSINREREHRAKDGTLLPVEIHSNLLQYEGQVYAVSFVQDISERKLHEEALREKDRLLGDIGILVKVGGWRYDIQTGVAKTTDAIAQIYDFDSAQECSVENRLSCYHGENQEKIRHAFREAVAHGTPYDLELELISATGKQKWVRTIGNPVWQDGRLVQVQGAIQDITEQKQLEEQVQQARKLEAIGQLAGGIAHDFNNMLTGIKGASEVLELVVADNSKAKKYIDLIHTATDRTSSLVDKLLAFGRKGKQFSSPVNVHTLLRETLVFLQSSIDKRITFATDLVAEQSNVIGDSGQLQSCFLNLFLNARDAMTDGGTLRIATTNIELDASSAMPHDDLGPGTYLSLTIQDSGHGIAQEVLPFIFEPFFTTKEIGQGTGLGLAAVYGTIKDHHGDISVSSTLGKGTLFTLLLPVEPVAPLVSSSQEGDEVVFGSGTILLVDDEEILRVTGEILLEEIGYTVILAEDGAEAVRKYQEQKETIDLIILDVVMPVMDGRDAYKCIRNLSSKVPVLFCSGYTKDVSLSQILEDERTSFVMKPFDFATLSKLIAALLPHQDFSQPAT